MAYYVARTAYAVGPSSHSVVFYTYAVGATRYQQSSTGGLHALPGQVCGRRPAERRVFESPLHP
jgi:hypothetical protein